MTQVFSFILFIFMLQVFLWMEGRQWYVYVQVRISIDKN
jgi:hypothetical protein